MPHPSFDAVAAVYVANLLAHRIEPIPDQTDSENDLAQLEEDLAAFGVLDQIGAWQEAMKDIRALMSEAEAK